MQGMRSSDLCHYRDDLSGHSKASVALPSDRLFLLLRGLSIRLATQIVCVVTEVKLDAFIPMIEVARQGKILLTSLRNVGKRREADNGMARSDFIPLFDLEYGPEEEEAVSRVLRSRWLTMGGETRAFEEEFAAYLGVGHAVGVSSCSAALHLALLAAGVGPCDEVICPSLTFVSTAHSILHAGAEPVFADVKSLNDWTLDPEDVERKITGKTRAVIVMHYGGFACDMTAIGKLARERGLKVIEDAAHAPGGEYRGKKLGALGDFSCFSFFSNKNISTGEGGMACANSAEDAEKIQLLRSHGMTSLTLDRHKGHRFDYDVVEKGFNYRIDEIHSALGRAQLKKLEANNRARAEAAEVYRDLLTGQEMVEIPFEGYEDKANHHIFPVLLDSGVDRLKCMKFLREANIQTSIHYRPVHTFAYYRRRIKSAGLPNTEEIGRRELTLPMYPGLTRPLVERVAGKLLEFLKS